MKDRGIIAAAPNRLRPVVLTFARYFLPGFRAGGPIRSIANLVDRLGEEFEFRIVTLDRDFGDRQPYPAVATDSWVRLGKAWVMYVQRPRFGLGKVATIAQQTPHDLVYLNSFFDPLFTQQVLLSRLLNRLPDRPVVIAPRGEFSEGALQIKRFKKAVFMAVGRVLQLHKDVTWQATSPHEAEDIGRHIKPNRERIILAPNVSWSPTNHDCVRRPRAPGAPLRVCFLSRVSRMKNLDYALRVLARVQNPTYFAIYGPMEDQKYWDECQDLLAKLPSNIHAVYSGELRHAEVESTLRRHDVFFFPTRGENFGHVIQEALSAGLPVLISDQTPWRDLQQHGIGWALSLDQEQSFADVIQELASWDAARFDRTAELAMAYATKNEGTEEILARSRILFRKAMAQRTA